MRLDVHIHYTPPELAAELGALAEREPYWGMLLAPRPSGASIQGWADAARTLEDMDRAGIDRVVVQGEYYQRHESCVARNDASMALVRRFPDRIAAFAVVQPRAGPLALAELERCVAGGLCGVGELNPYAQGFALDDPDFLRLAEACIRHGLPLLLHANEPVGPAYPGKATTPLAHYYGLACRYPELQLVLAHWGGGLLFHEIIPGVRRALRNTWYDTAASPLVYPTPAIFRAALACVDHRKILFASDYPLLICPREQREPDFRPFLRQIDALGLDETVYTDIMGGNAVRLLAQTTEDRGQEPGARSREVAESNRPPILGPQSALPGAIDGTASVALVAAMHPAARDVFARYGIPWQDSAVPFWEPIAQAAAAHGHGPEATRRLLAELNEAAGTPSGMGEGQAPPPPPR
ncbi:MAG TPA: amidohydrolase family protein [Roseiflexaceae bacterium]|nr:amidohydrolase family protein [Roseiflexaceae bacterium]